MEINKIYLEDCLETMKRMSDNSISLTVTSPPYDDLRTYNGYSFPFEDIAKELFRITKHGGVVVWVVGDSTKNGSESLTSFKQALYFKEIGLNINSLNSVFCFTKSMMSCLSDGSWSMILLLKSFSEVTFEQLPLR